MTDIVKRLRRLPSGWLEHLDAEDDVLEAADEIERMSEYIEGLGHKTRDIKEDPCYAALWDETEKNALLENENERLKWESSSDHNRWATERLNLLAEIERLRAELAGADCIANGWQKQNLELRSLLRFFFERVPVIFYNNNADVMTRTEEILGHHE